MKNTNRIDLLKEGHLSREELKILLDTYTPEDQAYAACLSRKITDEIYDHEIYIRGLIEISSYCKNDCYYCGLRKSNTHAMRYHLTKEDILACCQEGYEAGFRTFVMQGGEDLSYDDEKMCDIIATIRAHYPDCAITLSLGEKEKETYEKYYQAGANRYLLRHETYNEAHYYQLHPQDMSFQHRIQCLHNLKEIGFQTGCGFMVGSPGQTNAHLVNDLMFIKELTPEMVGIGPYLVHHDTPFKNEHNGDLEKTLFLLSLIRIMHPHVLLPATTALATLHPEGRSRGIQLGCNVIMPNLSPRSVREKYMLYDHKANTGQEAKEGLKDLTDTMARIGYQVVVDRGDFK